MDVLQTPLIMPVRLVCPITFVPKGLMESKVCPMDSFNTAFSPACPSLPFVLERLIDSKGCPMDSINIAFSPACPSLPFVPKGLMESKVCPM